MTGEESIIEKWILSRLHAATKEADDGWKLFDLSRCTTAIYNFWLYELCDVYLVRIFDDHFYCCFQAYLSQL